MAFLQIKSNNPQLSFAIMKNPESGVLLKKYRQGTLAGYFSKGNNQVYNVFFKDGDDEISFKKNRDDEFEYNDTKRYNSALFIQGAVNNFFRDFTNKEHNEEYDPAGKFEHEILINQLEMFNIKYIDLIERYYPKFTINLVELSPKNFQVSIKTKETLRDLVNFTYILSMFYHCLSDPEGIWIEEGEISRYATILNNLDSPYFIRYVVKSRVIKSPKKFLAIKSELEKCSYQDIDMVFGDTHSQRSDFITEHVSDKNEVIDLGCNNMRSYGLKIARKLNKTDVLYHAIDIDEEALNMAKRKMAHNALENVLFYNSLEELTDLDYKQKFTIIMSEVFEHIELKEDTKIIKELLKKVDFDKLIITTPNRDFNKFYQFTEDQTRLDDHKFEMTKMEFQDYFTKLLSNVKGVRTEFFDIGDVVNGVTPTQAVIIYKD